MDYVYILTPVKIPEAWTRSTPYSILKEVCSDAVTKFIADPQALILIDYGGVLAMLQKDEEEDDSELIFKNCEKKKT